MFSIFIPECNFFLNYRIILLKFAKVKKEKKKLHEYTTHMYMYHENEHDSAKKKQKGHGPHRSTEKPVQINEYI